MTISAELGQLEAFVSDLVAKGRYASASEVLCEGVRLLQARERREAELEAALACGLEDVSEGRVVVADKVFDRLEAKYEAIPAREP